MWLTTKKFTIISILVLYLLFGPEVVVVLLGGIIVPFVC